MDIVAIPRRASLDPETFERDHIAHGGTPVILTDCVQHWPAFRKWTWDFLKREFGHEVVPLHTGLGSRHVKVTKLATFIDHVQDPAADFNGFWLDTLTGALCDTPASKRAAFHLFNFHAFRGHPGLFNDIQPFPSCIDDWEAALTTQVREKIESISGYESTSLYIGAPGTVSQLHQDFWGTHGWLAQVHGHKKVILFSPDTPLGAETSTLDPQLPDVDAHPAFRGARAHEAVLAPGELLFTPSRWWHWVQGLAATVTVSHNFFNRANASEHIERLLR